MKEDMWWDHTWSPITGCTKISEGCEHCWAERMAHRLAGRYGYPEAPNQFRPTFHRDKLEQPLKWKKPRRIFVCSMGDIFHDDVNVDWIDSIIGIIEACKQHTFMVLTKRPENFEEKVLSFYHNNNRKLFSGGFPKNVWIGVTAENQKQADERIPILLTIPAAVRFVSVEPMLGPANLGWANNGRHLGLQVLKYSENARYRCGFTHRDIGPVSLAGKWGKWKVTAPIKPIPELNWVICGAETGPKKRPMDLDWARSLRDQCVAAGVPFFFKKDSAGNHELDGETWEQFPK